MSIDQDQLKDLSRAISIRPQHQVDFSDHPQDLGSHSHYRTVVTARTSKRVSGESGRSAGNGAILAVQSGWEVTTSPVEKRGPDFEDGRGAACLQRSGNHQRWLNQ